MPDLGQPQVKRPVKARTSQKKVQHLAQMLEENQWK